MATHRSQGMVLVWSQNDSESRSNFLIRTSIRRFLWSDHTHHHPPAVECQSKIIHWLHFQVFFSSSYDPTGRLSSYLMISKLDGPKLVKLAVRRLLHARAKKRYQNVFTGHLGGQHCNSRYPWPVRCLFRIRRNIEFRLAQNLCSGLSRLTSDLADSFLSLNSFAEKAVVAQHALPW